MRGAAAVTAKPRLEADRAEVARFVDATFRYADVGADATASSIVHPLRWPCSWHRKNAPRLARIVDLRSEIEIEPAQVIDLVTEVLRRKTCLLAQIID